MCNITPKVIRPSDTHCVQDSLLSLTCVAAAANLAPSRPRSFSFINEQKEKATAVHRRLQTHTHTHTHTMSLRHVIITCRFIAIRWRPFSNQLEISRRKKRQFPYPQKKKYDQSINDLPTTSSTTTEKLVRIYFIFFSLTLANSEPEMSVAAAFASAFCTSSRNER